MSEGNRARNRASPTRAWSPRAAALATSPDSEQFDRGEGGGAGHRVTAVGRAVRARPPGLEQLRPRDQGPERHPGGDPLRRQQDVRLHAPVLHRPHPPRTTRAGLDLVGDQEDPVLVADLSEPLEEPILGHDVPALALDRLDDDRRDLVGRAPACRRGPPRTSAGPRPDRTARGTPRAGADRTRRGTSPSKPSARPSRTCARGRRRGRPRRMAVSWRTGRA